MTLVQRGDRLVSREDPRVGALTQDALEGDGIDVRLGRQVRRAAADGAGARVELDDGSRFDVDVVVLGTGRRPRTGDLGLDTVGVDVTALGGRGLPVDEQCRFGDGLWAIGDVTGRALFTHVAKYQGRVAADTIAGSPRSASYDGIPLGVGEDDRDRQVLIGAWAVAPLAGEWIHQAALAIRAQVPLGLLRDQVPQFPTYTEAHLAGLERLDA